MRLSCFLIISLLAVVFSTFNDGACSPAGLSKRRHEEVSPHSPNHGVPKLESPSSGKEIGVELTKDLTAEQWNELLGKLGTECGNHEGKASFLCYTSNRSEEQLLEIFEEALTKNFEHLFREMCDMVYFPRTPSVMGLLERGLKVYPHLRRSILLIIYRLEYPTTRWHLGNNKEDLDLLKELIEKGGIKSEAIASHLAEMAALYPPEVLDLLIKHEIIAMKDLCTMELYLEVCSLGGRGYLQWAKQADCDLIPGQECIDAAVSKGRDEVIDFIAEEFGMTLVPSQKAVNKAATNGQLALLVNRCTAWGLFPKAKGANGAAKNGHIEVLKWLVAEQKVYPGQYGANVAAKNGHIEVLKWMAALEPQHRVYPDQSGANDAALKGHLKVVEWLAERQIYPNRRGAGQVPVNDNSEVVRLLGLLKLEEADEPDESEELEKRQEPEQRLYPNHNVADVAAHNGHPEVLKRPAEQEFYAAESQSNEGFNTKEKLHGLSKELSLLNELRTEATNSSETLEFITIFLNRIAVQRQLVEGVWSICLDKMSAYSQNQDFFKNALPVFVEEVKRLPDIKKSVLYTADNFLGNMETFCEQKSLTAFLRDLVDIWSFSNNCNAFEGLSDEFLTLIANYMRSTINIRKLYLILENPQAFTGSRFQTADDSIYKSWLVLLVVKLRKLVSELQAPDLMETYRRFSSALEVTKRNMVPANKDLVHFLTDFLAWEISSLADKARGSLSIPCYRARLEKHAEGIVADIEHVTMLLQHGDFNVNCGIVKQRGRIEICWDSFIRSLLACERVVSDSNLDIVAKASETVSDLFNNFLDTFLRGEDEVWVYGLNTKLCMASNLWNRALEKFLCPPAVEITLPWTKYVSWVAADLLIVSKATSLVESLEDPLALDRPTREKLVEYWREAQAFMRLFLVLSALEGMANTLGCMVKRMTDEFVEKSLNDMMCGEIAILKRRGINFHQGKYHRFIDELPEHQQQIAQSLREFSDSLACLLAEGSMVKRVGRVFLCLKSRAYDHLKQSLRELSKSRPQSALQSPPQPLQPQSRPSHMSRPKSNKSRKKARKPTQTPESHRQSADPKEPTPDKRQVFVRGGPQYVNVEGVSGSAGGGLKVRGESSENPWNLVIKSCNLQNCGSLVKQPAREVLNRFRGKPRGWDGVFPTNPQDMRSDKKRVKMAVFNVEWLFFFDLATDKLCGKVKWKSLSAAWDHIRDVADAIRKIDADIICLYEVQDLRILSILVGLLPKLNYRAYLLLSHDSLDQNVGILTRVDTFASISRVEKAFFPKNLVIHFRLDNGCGGLAHLVLSSVHLISSTAEADPVKRARLRVDQAKALKKHLMDEYAPSNEIIHMVLGDFNMVDPTLLPVNYSHPSEEALEVIKHEAFDLVNAMRPTNAPSDLLSNNVCHIFTSHPHLVSSAQIVSLDGGRAAGPLTRVSDHAPIVATIHLPN